jgi:hypothetical protein
MRLHGTASQTTVAFTEALNRLSSVVISKKQKEQHFGVNCNFDYVKAHE